MEQEKTIEELNQEKLEQEKKYEAERKVAEEARKRIQSIADAIIDLYITNDVIVSELSAINNIVDEKVNKNIRESTVKYLIK